MIYTPMTIRAMQLAYEAHSRQVDRAGVPYIFHPIHLAEQMDDEVSVTVALLHDVAESTNISLEELGKIFPREVMVPLTLLTHDRSVNYFDYIRALKENPVARCVKLADLEHNSDESRLSSIRSISEPRKRRLKEKYRRAHDILMDLTEGAGALKIRPGTPEDLDLLAAAEAECFPPDEAATREQLRERLATYAQHFWLLFDGDELAAYIDGPVTDHADLEDAMYEDASCHDPNGRWQMIFGLGTLPGHRRNGCAAALLYRMVQNARVQGRLGVVLTCRDHMVPYYAKFGFKNEGLSRSVHGGGEWLQMRLTFADPEEGEE